MNRIKDKIKQINGFLEDLRKAVPDSLEKYEQSVLEKPACERFFEKIAEAMTDLAFIVIKINKMNIPDDDIDAFNILTNNGWITNELSVNLKDAKGMRNILCHEYGKIDDKLVYHAITEEIEYDINDFIKSIERKLKLE